jgi:hypothetical protein
MSRRLFSTASILGIVVAFVGVTAPTASATKPDPLHSVTICHRTNSVTHPYVQITVDEASVDGNSGNDNGHGDHLLEHLGPVFDVNADPDVAYPPPHNGDQWGDIIPPFYADGQTPTGYPSLNWDAAGQAIFEAGCKIPNEPEETFFAVTKAIPDVLEGDETVTIELSLFFVENGQAAGLVTTDNNPCELTFEAGDTQKKCTFEHLTPGVDYVLVETETGGFTPFDPYYFTGGDASGTTEELTLDNTFGPASAEACKTVDTDATGYDATGDTFSFDLVFKADPSLRLVDGLGNPLYQPDDVIETVDVVIGTSTTDPDAVNNCTAFATVLADNVTYDIVEQAAPAGWSTTGGIDEFTPQYPGDAAHVYSASFTNSITAATAKACKITSVVNGYGFDPSQYYFKFTLKDGTSPVSYVYVQGGGTAASPKCETFKTEDGSENFPLQDGHTYTVVEAAKLFTKSGSTFTEVTPTTGWTFGSVSCTVGTTAMTSYTPSYPGASGAEFKCKATNTRTFAAPLTPGYWKNHLAFDRKNPTLPYTAAYLPIRLGGYVSPSSTQYYFVSTTANATSVFNSMNCSNTGSNSAMNQNAVGCLAGHLLATKLNLANGSDGTCITAYVTQGDNFLTSVAYVGPTGNYSGIGAANRNSAIAIKNALDKYNNGLGCS